MRPEYYTGSVIIFGMRTISETWNCRSSLATGFGQCVPIVIYIAAYLKRPKRVAFRREYLHLTREVTKRLYSIGVPAILNMALTSVLTTALNAILAAFSQTYVLVLGIIINCKRSYTCRLTELFRGCAH